MRLHAPFILAALMAAPLAALPAAAQSLPVNETTYVERSLNRDGPLVIEHRPIPARRAAGAAAHRPRSPGSAATAASSAAGTSSVSR